MSPRIERDGSPAFLPSSSADMSTWIIFTIELYLGSSPKWSILDEVES